MRKLYSLVVLFCIGIQLTAQDFSNKGKDFWLGYGSHVSMYTGAGAVNASGGTQSMVLYIATDQATTVTVAIPLLGYTQTYNIPANTVFTTPAIPKTGVQDARLGTEGISDKGIHVTANKNVVAYTHIYNGSISGATLLFPENVLGKEYYSINFTQTSNENNSYPYFFVVAVDTGTTVIEVTPTANTQSMTAGTTYTYNLQQGQVYNALGQLAGQSGVDLTGSKIKSISTAATGCKKIAVFSGSGKLNVNCSGSSGSADNYIVQAFPKEAWGKRFLTVPTVQMPYNFYRICVSDPSAIVKRNGVVLGGLINNFYYQVGQVNDLGLIESDKAITVAQYITTRNRCTNTPFGASVGNTEGLGDPEVIYLSPVEQNISKVNLYTTPNAAINTNQHYVNVVIKTAVINTFKIDNVNYASSFLLHPQDPTYSYLQQNLSGGVQHLLEADSGFNAIVYGYGSAESYGYNAGTNVKDFTQYATVSNNLADSTITFAAACKNSPFNLFQRLPYKPLSITWDFTGSGLPNPPFTNYTNNTPATIFVDSTLVSGKWIYKYKNPNLYSVPTAGAYPITIRVNNPTSEGCSGLQEIDYELNVFDPPVADFTWTHTGCASDTVYFQENSTITGGRPVYKWRWIYSDNSVDSIKTPKKLFGVGGCYPVKLQMITDVGCLSDTLTKVVGITNAPTTTISLPNAAAPTCANTAVMFRSTTTITGAGGNCNGTGTSDSAYIVKWAWNWGDGSPTDTILNGNDIPHTYIAAGTYTVNLTVITNGVGCKGASVPFTIIISNPPAVSFTLPANVCLPNAVATFTNTSLVTNTYSWNFGDGSANATTYNGTNTYSSVGPFTVTLTGTGVGGCTATSSLIFNNIRPRPTATFTNNAEVCINKPITFTSTSTGNGGTINDYYWDNGTGIFAIGTNTLTTTFATTGIKTIRHYIKTDQGCLSDTSTNTIFVNANPVANFSYANLGRCTNAPITFTNNSTSTNGVITNWSWDFGDATPIVNATNGNPQIHVYANTGTFDVKLVVTTDKGCVADTFKLPITITASPLASFIPPGGICLPSGFAQFTNNTTISDGTIATVTYLWDFGDATATSTATSPSHNYAGTGPYTVKLTAKSAIGCTDDSTQIVSNIYAQPTASISGNAEVCLNDNITFTSTSNPLNGTITQYYWDNGTGTFALGTNTLTTSFTTIGNKTVRHYIVTSNGCKSDTASKTIFVNQLPTASFTISATKCEKGNITFTSTSVPNNGTIVEWTWDFGDGTPIQTFTNGTPVIHVYTNAGPYTIKLTVKTDKGCTSIAASNNIVVDPKPVTNFDLPSNVCLPVGASLFNNTTSISNGSLPTVTYIWNFGDATATTTTTNGVHNYTAVGPFNVNLQATSNSGCVHDTTKVFNNIRPRPTATFTNNAEVCVNTSITFTSTSTGNGGTITDYYWDNGTGTFALGTNTLAATFATSGTKTIRHYIKTDQGCISDTATKNIYVNALPTPNFTFTAPQCAEKTITFTNTSVANDGVLNSWIWDFGDGTPIVVAVNGNPQTHTFTNTGTYNVSLTVTTSKSCTNSPKVLPVTISANPVVKMYLPEICLNDPTAQFLDSTTIADGTESQFTYLWNFGDPNATILNPNTSTLKNPTHKYTQAAVYNMWLEVTSNKGCTTRKDTTFTVNGSIPVANFAVQNVANLCSNKAITIQNTSTVDFGNLTKVEVYWDFAGNPLTKTVDDSPTPGKLYTFDYPDFGVPATKTYTVRFVAYSGGICVNAINKTVTILGSPNVTFNAIPDICLEIPTATLTQAQETTGIVGVGIFTGNGISGGQFNPVIAGVGSHLITYTYTASNGCSDVDSQTVVVNPTPNVTAGPDRTVLEGGNTTLLGNSTTPNVTYLWQPATYLSSVTIPQPTCTALADINYSLKVTSDKGCVATDFVSVKLLKGPRIPNAFSPNGDGINDKWDIEFLDTYPGCTIEVFNIYGQKIYNSTGYSKPWDGNFSGKPLPIGTYYYIIDPKNGRSPITGYVGIVR